MPTSSRFVVAVHALAAMAVGDGAPLRSEDLAAGQYQRGRHPGVLSRLHQAELTTSQLGAGGGALLAKPASRIRLLDVYAAVEDTTLFTLHRTPPLGGCAVGGNIQEAIRPVLTAPYRHGGGAGRGDDRRHCRRRRPPRQVRSPAQMGLICQ